MTREDITKQFPEATKEQIDALLNIHSADIGKAKGDAAKLQGDLKAVQDQLTTANATIAEMEKHKGDVAALQKKIDDFKAADDAWKQAEAAAQARQALLSRMDKVLGERKFIHERMRELIADDFDKALKDPANQGRSDADVFEDVTKDQNYFASQAGDFQMAGFGPANKGNQDYESQMRAALGLPEKK